jgi:hypothetical protein
VCRRLPDTHPPSHSLTRARALSRARACTHARTLARMHARKHAHALAHALSRARTHAHTCARATARGAWGRGARRTSSPGQASMPTSTARLLFGRVRPTARSNGPGWRRRIVPKRSRCCRLRAPQVGTQPAAVGHSLHEEHPVLPLGSRYIAATHPSRSRYISMTQPLHSRYSGYIGVTYPLRIRYVAVM